MPVPRFVAWSFPALMALSAGAVFGQDFPSKPIRMLTSGVGGDGDLLLRIILPEISRRFGQPIIIENRPAGIIPAEIVYKAAPDGYTLYTTSASFWIGSLLQKTPYDVMRDFSPVTLLTQAPAMLVVHPSIPANSVADLIALAKAKPGVLNYGSGGTGSTSHMAAEMLNYMAGVNIVRVNYPNGGARMTAGLTNEVQLQFTSPGLAAPHVKSGKLKGLAVTSIEPTALAPGVPTVAASGVPGYEVVSLTGMFAPAKTPTAIIARVNQEFVRYINQPDVRQRILEAGEEVSAGPPEMFRSRLKAQMSTMGKLINNLGIAAK